MPQLRGFLEAGLQGLKRSLSRQGVDMKHLFEEHSQGEDRTLVLRVRSPKGRREEFAFYIDTGTWEIGISEGHALPKPTARITLDEDLMWLLASRQIDLFTAYFARYYRQHYPVEVEGDYVLRDIKVLDKMLQLICDCLLAEGVDLAAILAPQ